MSWLLDEEELPKRAKYRITDAEFDEVSVVDRSDNPAAKIVLWKRQSVSDPPAARIEKTPREKEKTTMTKTAAYSAIKARAAELEAQGVEPAEALAKAMDESPELVKRYREHEADPAASYDQGPYLRAAAAERVSKSEAPSYTEEFLSAVRWLEEEHDMSPDEAWREAQKRRNDLYHLARAEGIKR